MIKIEKKYYKARIDEFCNELRVPKEVNKFSMDLVRNKQLMSKFSNCKPEGIIAAIVYIACLVKKHRRTQYELKIISGVTIMTIGKKFREIREMFKELYPVEYKYLNSSLKPPFK